MSDKIDTGMPMERNWVATGDKSGMSQWSTKRFTGPLWRQPTLRAYNHPVQGENLERGGLMKQVRSAVADSIQTARSEQGAGDSREVTVMSITLILQPATCDGRPGTIGRDLNKSQTKDQSI